MGYVCKGWLEDALQHGTAKCVYDGMNLDAGSASATDVCIVAVEIGMQD